MSGSDDLPHWAEYGSTTPQQLDDYLDLEAYANVYSQATPDDVGGEQPAASLVERAARAPGFILLG